MTILGLTLRLQIQQPDTFVCITSKADSASELIKNSPLRFKFVFISETLESIRQRSAPGTQYISVAAPIEIHEHHVEEGTGQDLGQPSNPKSTPELIKTFKVHIHPSSNYYNHRKTIRRNPLFGRWPPTLDEDQDSVYFALRNVVPDNIARKGLCDWNTGEQLSEDAKVLRASGGELAKAWSVYERQARMPTELLLEKSAEDELVAWTSVDSEIRLRDRNLARADELATAESEWQKLEEAVGANKEASRPRNFKPRTAAIGSVKGYSVPVTGEGDKLPRALRRVQYQKDHMKRRREKLAQSKQRPPT